MKVIDPAPGRMKELLESAPKDTPIVMINLLKFRDQANYPADADFSPCTGPEAYKRYSKEAFGRIQAVGGEVVYAGTSLGGLISPEGESWDKALLVRYPSTEHFVKAIMDPEYQAITVHRTAALDDSRLIMTQEGA